MVPAGDPRVATAMMRWSPGSGAVPLHDASSNGCGLLWAAFRTLQAF